jgi:hypothetical protein
LVWFSFIKAHLDYFPDRSNPNSNKVTSTNPIAITIRHEINPRFDRSGFTFFDPGGL